MSTKQELVSAVALLDLQLLNANNARDSDIVHFNTEKREYERKAGVATGTSLRLEHKVTELHQTIMDGKTTIKKLEEENEKLKVRICHNTDMTTDLIHRLATGDIE